MKAELFNTELLGHESIFNGEPGVYAQILTPHSKHSILIDQKFLWLVREHKWWRERNEETGQCYFRTDATGFPVPRPELHRIIAGVFDTDARVKFRNGCCFDLRKANLLIVT